MLTADLDLAREYLTVNPPPGRLLLCGVSGAHMYGFPAPDSDLSSLLPRSTATTTSPNSLPSNRLGPNTARCPTTSTPTIGNVGYYSKPPSSPPKPVRRCRGKRRTLPRSMPGSSQRASPTSNAPEPDGHQRDGLDGQPGSPSRSTSTGAGVSRHSDLVQRTTLSDDASQPVQKSGSHASACCIARVVASTSNALGSNGPPHQSSLSACSGWLGSARISIRSP